MTHFSEPCQQALQVYLQSEKNPHFCLEPEAIFGCIFAVAAAPEIPLPTTWLPWIFKPPVDSRLTQQVDKVSELAMLYLQWQLKQMRDGNCWLTVI